MPNSFESLLKSWQSLDLNNPPYILPGDQETLNDSKTPISSMRDFADWHSDKDFGQRPPHELQAGLLPVPYVGDLRKARIFLLTLNPGFEPLDLYGEHTNRDFKKDLVHNLTQSSLDSEYPFLTLNPKNSWHGGYKYWSKRFSDLTAFFQTERKCSFRQSLAFIAQNVAVMEAAPYHSTSFDVSKKVISQLQSSRAIYTFVKEELVPRALEGKILLIVLRANWFWELNASTNVIIYKQSEARGSSLSLNSRGGQAIQSFLNKT
jgi:hypothetical protein